MSLNQAENDRFWGRFSLIFVIGGTLIYLAGLCWPGVADFGVHCLGPFGP